MADAITDNRTLPTGGDANAIGSVWVDLSDSGTPTLDTEIKIQGSGSMGKYCTTTRDGTFYKYAADTDLSNNHVYIWVNCGIVGLLDTKGNQGFTFRARGPTVSNYLEWDMGGSDSWPNAVEGGWVQFVIDLESTPSRTNGTPPATTAIRSFGMTFITASVMPRMSDNTWIDEVRTLADGTAGVLVQGQNGGTTPWTFSDIVTQLGVATGTVRDGPGGSIVCNTPIQFGANDAVTHDFTDTNKTIIWDNQEFVGIDLYSLNIIGGSGSQKFELGIKTGTGNDATGAQGCIVQAADAGTRWALDADDANIDICNLYGCTLIHGGDFQFDNTVNEMISCLLNDVTTITANGALVQRNTIVNANTVDDVAFIVSDDVDNIKFNSFEFSDGHAIEYNGTATATETLTGNIFIGYGVDGSTDAAFFNSNTSGTLTLNISQASSPTVKTGSGGTTNIVVSVDMDITVKNEVGANIENARIAIEDLSGTQLMNELTNASGFATEAFGGTTPEDITVYVRKTSEGTTRYINFSKSDVITSDGLTLSVTMRTDTISQDVGGGGGDEILDSSSSIITDNTASNITENV